MSSKNMNFTPIVLMGLLVVVSLFDTCSCVVSCQEGLSQLLPCVGFLVGREPDVSALCCQGVGRLRDLAKTKPDIRTLCFCFKDAIRKTKFHVDLGRAKSLPDKCHVTVPVPIDPNIDCNKIAV